MNIFLCGQKSFGAAVLSRLISDGHNITGIAPPPRSRLLDPMEKEAVRLGIDIMPNCEALRGKDIPGDTDLIIAAHSHWFISSPCREAARYGAIGFHPSLLPRHRGIDAVRWAIAFGDAVSGGTVFFLDDGVDTGPVISQRHVFVGRGWTHHELWRVLFPVGVDMLSEAVSAIQAGRAVGTPQDETFATWEPAYDAHSRLYRPELLALS